jgi:hypothetical protein
MRYFLGTFLTFIKAVFTNEHELFSIRNKIKRRNKTIKPVSDKDLG